MYKKIDLVRFWLAAILIGFYCQSNYAAECGTFSDTLGLSQDPTNSHVLIDDSCTNTSTWSFAQPIFIYPPQASSPYTVNNSGTMNAGGNAIEVYTSTSVGIVNSGTISSYGQSILIDSGSVLTLTNNGTITSTNDNRGIVNSGTITQLINTGTITSTIYGIKNYGTIGILSNQQGGNISSSVSNPLYFYGNLPTTYNVILGSTGAYGQLSVTRVNYWDGSGGLTAFGIDNNSVVKSQKYSAVISGVTSDYFSSFTGTYGSYNYQLVLESGQTNIWDLVFLNYGPSAADTQSSLLDLALKLRVAYNRQVVATSFASMGTYDCDLFDEKGICVSVGGQHAYVDNPSSNLSSGVLVLGYKVASKIRIGSYLNQNINHSTASNVQMSNANPLMGLFAVWNQSEDYLGYQIKVSNAYQDNDITTTREIIGASEAGIGSANLNTQSYVGELSYAFLINQEKSRVRPYFAVRYTRIKQDRYIENSTESVQSPLTYAALEDTSFAALVGVKLDHKLTEQLGLKANIAIEQDIHHYVGKLTATSSDISGLSSENFNDNIQRTRTLVSLGAFFTPVKNHRISADLLYQQLAFRNTASTAAYMNYMIGF